MANETLRSILDKRRLIESLLEDAEKLTAKPPSPDAPVEEREQYALACSSHHMLSHLLLREEGQLEDKVAGWCLYMESLKGDIGSLKAQEAHLREQRGVLERRQERMRDYILDAALLEGEPSPGAPIRWAGHGRRITVSLGGYRVTRLDIATLPIDYKEWIPAEWRPCSDAKRRLAQLAKRNEELPPGVEVEAYYRTLIR